jgi:transposase
MSVKSMNTTVWIGLDVSKDTIDVCLLRTNGKTHFKQFANDNSGHSRLLRWAQHMDEDGSGHFCLEATGSYSLGVALFLSQAGQNVSVINPARIHFFARSQGQGNKTDKADARIIALFCSKEQPEPWRAAAPEVRELVALMRRYHAVQDLLVQEKNRFQAPSQPKAVLASVKTTMRFLEKEVERLKKQIQEHFNQHDGLKRDAQLLQSIPGVGEVTAWDILAEMPDVGQFDSAQAVAAYAGLAPREHQSGSSVRKRTRLSKQGNARLRKAVFFPAISALTWNPLVKAHYERLRAAGKTKMVALAAAIGLKVYSSQYGRDLCVGTVRLVWPVLGHAAIPMPLELLAISIVLCLVASCCASMLSLMSVWEQLVKHLLGMAGITDPSYTLCYLANIPRAGWAKSLS